MILPELNKIPSKCDAKMAGLLYLFTFSEQWMDTVATDTDISNFNCKLLQYQLFTEQKVELLVKLTRKKNAQKYSKQYELWTNWTFGILMNGQKIR